MIGFVFISLNTVFFQTIGAWMRWLPFRSSMTDAETRLLRRRILMWSATLFAIYLACLNLFGSDAAVYKILLLTGWLPHFLISMTVIRNRLGDHVFVLSMQSLWVLMLHTLTIFFDEILLALFDPIGNETALVHGVNYTVILLASLHWAKQLFENLLIVDLTLDERFKRYGWSLPLALFLSTLLPIFSDWDEGDLFQSMPVRMMRFLSPLFFFITYRVVSMSMRQIDEQRQREHVTQLMNRQLETLKQHNLIMQRHREQLAIFRHDLRHNYRLIGAMIDGGKIQEAIDYLKTQDALLAKNFCSEKKSAPKLF